MPAWRADRSASARPDVWIVNHYANAADRPAGTRHFDLARQLVARGHRVTVFASAFSHVLGRHENLGKGRLYRSESIEGVRFVWVWSFPSQGNTWRRPINMLSFAAVFLVVQARFRAPDVVIGSTVHPFAALGAWLVARLRRAQFLFEVRDLWPQTLVDLGAMRDGSPGERLLRLIEAFLVRRASAVITVLPGMRDYLLGRRLPADHVVYIPNGVDLAASDGAAGPEAELPEAVRLSLEAIGRMRSGGRFILGYAGSFGFVNRLDVVIRAAAIAESRAPGTVGLVLVGDGPEKPKLEAVAAEGGAVAFCPAVPKRFVPLVLRSLDATVVHATETPVYRYGISFNKLFDYMAAERPVVFACTSAYDPVAATGAGLSVHPDDPSVLANAFLEMASTPPAVRTQMGAAGREYVAREHNMERLGETLASVLAPVREGR